jgi:hypothetical protein
MSGYLQNAKGESSHTKLINMGISICIIVVWVLLCWHKKEIVPIDPTILALIGVPTVGNSINKFIENNADKQKTINQFVAKLKAKKSGKL